MDVGLNLEVCWNLGIRSFFSNGGMVFKVGCFLGGISYFFRGIFVFRFVRFFFLIGLCLFCSNFEDIFGFFVADEGC